MIVESPDPATAPACCTQRTVTTGRDAQPKVEQEHYWGSRKWKHRYNARTYVEGAFGNMKNTTTENVERGFFQVTGLAKVNFMVGIALVAHNLRMLRGNTPSSNPARETCCSSKTLSATASFSSAPKKRRRSPRCERAKRPRHERRHPQTAPDTQRP